MNCDLFREMTFDYLEGRLDAWSLSDFREHFGACGSCATTLRAVEGQETLLMSMPRPKAPDTLWGRIRKDLSDRALLRRRPPVLILRWGAAVAAALLVAATLTMGRPAEPEAAAPVRRVVDITAQAGSGLLGRMVPGFENPGPSAPLLDLFAANE